VRGLADPLGERIRYNTWVIGLHVRPDCVLVEARHGAKTTVTACDYVLCTLPFSVLRRLRLSGISDEKLALIHDMPYWSAVKIAMHCREAFWERDGIAGGGSFVGGLVRQTYYPPVENDPRQGAAFLASYAIGPDAERIERLSRWERVVAVLGELAAIHPALSEPGMVLGVVAQAWGEDPTALGAASVRWSKDARTAQQQQELAARPQGRLFFAGEHCSSFPAWIEGAVESGEAASMEIHAFGPGAHRPPIRVSST
jgi:monoamine oxidase